MSGPPGFGNSLLEAVYDGALWAWTTCANTGLLGSGSNSQNVDIGGTQYRVIRHLGEGGFSIVLLVENVDTGEQYALKKMMCQQGTDMLEMAQREIDAYQRFHHPNIISLVGHSVEPADSMPGGSVVCMVFPLYRLGNLMDIVAHSQENSAPLSESFIIDMFRGICSAVQHLHSYGSKRDGIGSIAGYNPPQETSASSGTNNRVVEEEEHFLTESGLENGQMQPVTAATGGPYVHRDLKLANVMVTDDLCTPILMDFGSVARARITAETRIDALRIQDDAAENCTMPYRAPELFDVHTGVELDERTDIWSLGCLLFALTYGYTPFEDPQNGPGASIALAAINASYRYPKNSPYSDRIPRLIDAMLVPDPQERPFIGQVIELVDELYSL
ncbi:Serine/threonine-protein kinase env7 [Coemansia sp. RSA 1813]|nr:Serine/threonine-protein kinase env7 [Coemansia sp. RSA 1646]KAJ1772634.1 Serine/threonine-protein kinase env7 [Coemansia sp. RSA 1843]KAJ2090225.1 Serine/threonine-protein kinase env7 [Coemansia sp. RSA 986]KAJ2214630.1 Serine/threonine-protein kinase env7 [Coemansia sp. RSA 487]KAJ2570708.1 Serine/threonine-protein kinase env7 [Coemansia sp. RSA 1813]